MERRRRPSAGRRGRAAQRRSLTPPAVLGVAVVAGLGYAVALGLGTPQNDFDTIFDHLWRAGLWRQNEAVGYPECACAPYVNAYPPHGEMGVLATMVLGGSDRYVSLVQASAFVALALGVIGSARAIGLGRSEALLGGLLVATLPVIALQASTAQNDLIVASFLVAAVVLLLDRGPALPWLAGAATALAVGTKVTAVIGIPCWPWSRSSCTRTPRPAPRSGAGGRGGRWILVRRQLVAGGKLGRGLPVRVRRAGVAAAVARGLRSAAQLVELPGAAGRDRWLYGVTAALLLAGLVAVLWRRRGPPRSRSVRSQR